MQKQTPERPTTTFEENLKKALSGMLILHLLSQREYYIVELPDAIRDKSSGALNIVFPYAAIYRLLDDDYITEVKKRGTADTRRRQYYQITDAGRAYLVQLKESYANFFKGVNAILDEKA